MLTRAEFRQFATTLTVHALHMTIVIPLYVAAALGPVVGHIHDGAGLNIESIFIAATGAPDALKAVFIRHWHLRHKWLRSILSPHPMPGARCRRRRNPQRA